MKKLKIIFAIVFMIFWLSACGSGQLFGPTVTPTFTITPTFTALPTNTLTSTPTLTPTPIVYDGDWYGSIGSGGKISFKISDNGIASIKISFGLTIKNGSCNVIMDTTISPPLSISFNEFSIATTELKISGKFDSPITASGTVEASASSPHCSGGINVEWTAQKQ